MSVTEQRSLKLAVDYEGTTINGTLELKLNKGMRVLYAHKNLVKSKRSPKGVQSKNEVVHDITFTNMRVETRRDDHGLASSSSSSSIRQSYAALLPDISMPAYLTGLEGSTPGIVMHEGVPVSMEIPFNVSDETLMRVAGSQGWTKAKLKDAYTSTSKGIYVIRVQDKAVEAISPVLRAYLSANDLEYKDVKGMIESGIAGVTQEQLDEHLESAHQWMDEILTSSLNLSEMKLLIKATNPNADSQRIKVSGIINITYSTLEATTVEKTSSKSTRKAEVSSSKKLSHGDRKHYGSDDDDSDSYSSEGSGSDDDSLDAPIQEVRSSILKKKSRETTKTHSSRSARVK